MNRALLDECFRQQGRQTWYIRTEKIQRDLDRLLGYYNLERSRQGTASKAARRRRRRRSKRHWAST
jgi:hypothetical protein